MANKVHEIAFQIAGQLAGNFSGTFKAANAAVDSFAKNLNAMNKEAAQIDKVMKLRQEVAELEQQISSTAQPTQELTNKLNKKRDALNAVESAAGTAGKSIDELTQRQKLLTDTAEKATQAQEKLARATELQSKFKGMISSGAMGMASTAAAAAPLVLTVKAAMDYEDMQAELGKFSDDAEGIFAGIKDLTGKYSKSAADMTAMAANAMQAGIAKTRDEVLTLVEAQTQAAVAFGMTGDAVGEAWASIQSKMGTSIEETQAVFDIVNKLGNETSASSEDILNVLQRQGGAVKSLTAMNEKQVAALAGAFRSASTSSEVAATSMGTFISRLTVGETATKAQQEAFEALGLDATEVAKNMTSSSAEAEKQIQEVFSRINKLSDDKRGAVIGQLFGNEAGIKAAVATMSAQTNLLGDNLEMVADSANYAGSMFDEYMARANTTSEALAICRNQVTTIAANLGQALLPTVKELAQSFIAVAQKVATFIAENQKLIGGLVKVVTVLLAAKMAFHGVQMVVGLIGGPIMGVVKAFRAYQLIVAQANMATATGTALTLKQKAAMLVHAAATKVTTVAQNLWTKAKNGMLLSMIRETAALVASKVALLATKGVMLLVTAAQWAWNAAMSANPIGLVIVAIGALIAIGVTLYKNWDVIVAKCTQMWSTFSSKFPAIANFVAVPFKQIITIAKMVWDVFKNVIGFIKNIFTGQWGAAWQNVKNIFASVWNGLVSLVKTPINAIIGLVNAAIRGINGISVDIPDWVPGFGGETLGFNIPEIPQLAEGGIATKPTMAMIGEGRESEAVLPLSKLGNMLDGGGGGGMTINFAPVINVSGGGNVADDVQAGIRSGYEELKTQLEKLQQRQRRLSYV